MITQHEDMFTIEQMEWYHDTIVRESSIRIIWMNDNIIVITLPDENGKDRIDILPGFDAGLRMYLIYRIIIFEICNTKY